MVQPADGALHLGYRLLAARALAFRDAGSLARAVEAFAGGKCDFADYVILAHAREAGCDRVATFDRALLREAHFEGSPRDR